MNLSNLLKGSYFRFACILIVTFLIAYIIAGYIALQALNIELEGRVRNSVVAESANYNDIYESGGRQALINTISSDLKSMQTDDALVWLGDSHGNHMAGHLIVHPELLKNGNYPGEQLLQGIDDIFYVYISNMSDLKLIIGRSYEESDAIRNVVLVSFFGATLIAFFVAFTLSVYLAARGQKRILNISKTLIYFSQGDLKQRISISRFDDDLNSLAIKINEALTKLQSTIDGIREVSINIAHDLRTPLNRLGIKVEKLRGGLRESKVEEESVQSISHDINNLTNTFDALLRIAQIESETNKSRSCPLDLNDLATSLYEVYQAVVEDNRQTLRLVLHADKGVVILGDKDLLIQLLANLVENSIRYSGNQSTITIEVGFKQKLAFMGVNDNGIGIPDSEKDNVIKRFYRLDKARHSDGSGLGLALVNAIAGFHSGDFLLRDNHPGLCATILFPAYKPGSVLPHNKREKALNE